MKLIIEQDNGKLTIRGSNRPIKIEYAIPEWNKDKENADPEPYFRYRNNRYYLSEFMRSNHEIPGFKYDGYMTDSYFSGIYIRYNAEDDNDSVFAYSFYC